MNHLFRAIVVSTILVTWPAPAAACQDFQEFLERTFSQSDLPGAVVCVVDSRGTQFEAALGFASLEEKTPLKVDAIMPIGSVTKVFTATLIESLVQERKLSWDDTLALRLDASFQLPEWVGRITLLELATHSSGLPRDPPNRINVVGTPTVMRPYSVAELYAGLGSLENASQHPKAYRYSNFGYGVLGHVAERVESADYQTSLEARVLNPLGMKETWIQVPVAEQIRIPNGYWQGDQKRVARERWKFGEIVGFAGLCNTAADLSKFVAANLRARPNSKAGDELAFLIAPRFPQALLPESTARSQAKGWIVDRSGPIEIFGHGGEVDSFSCVMAFIPALDVGLVVMVNQGDKSAEQLAMALLPKVISGVTEFHK